MKKCQIVRSLASHQCSLVASPSRDASLPQSAPTDPGSVQKDPRIRRSNPVLPWKNMSDHEKSDRRKLQQTCSNHLGGRVQGSAAPGLLTIMSCRMITTVIKCQQPSILPLSLFFSYLDVWGATTSRWEGGRLQLQTVSGTGPDPIFFLSLQAMENPRSLRVHEVTTSQIPAAWQWTTMPDMLGKMPQCHATFQIWYIYIYTYICIILSCILSCILSYIVLVTAPLAKHHQATQETKAQIQTRITATAMHQDPSARAHPKEAHLAHLWNW